MSIPGGRYKRLVEYNEIGGEKKTSVVKKNEEEEDDGEFKDNQSDIVEGEIQKEKANALSSRARVLARGDWGLFFIGSIGAVLAGLVFPGWGVVFAYMIELLYYPVYKCDSGIVTVITAYSNQTLTYNTCEEYWNTEADYLRQFSFEVSYAWLAIIASTLIGNVLLFYGFGAATERMNKRIRDNIFVALMRQDLTYYDTHSVSKLSTKLEDDAAMMHSFSGEPIRQLSMTVASLAVGLVLSFYFMW